jgi:hypothetical protein
MSSGVRIERPSNLTVYLIQRREYSPLRFIDAPVGESFCPTGPIAAAHQCRVAPCITPPADGRCDPWTPLYFPYDTPLPTGLAMSCEPTPERPRTVYRIHPLPPVTEQVGRMVDIYV